MVYFLQYAKTLGSLGAMKKQSNTESNEGASHTWLYQ